jgi:hypothetical protein
MHEIFKTRMAESNISITTLEIGIGCSRNYLSRFINGDQVLPKKWEPKIEEYLRLHQNPIINAVVGSVTDLPPELATKVDFSPTTAASYDAESLTWVEDECGPSGKMVSSKDTMAENAALKQQLATWVPPDQYDEMRARAVAAEAKVMELEQKLNDPTPQRFAKREPAPLSTPDTRKILNPNADRTKQIVEPEPGTTAYFIRHGHYGNEIDGI